MSSLLLHNGKVVTPSELILAGELGIDGSCITHIGPKGSADRTQFTQIVDVGGLFICPGLIELHTNGALGHDFLDASAEDLEEIAAFQARHGTTGFLATLCTAAQSRTVRAAQIICSAEHKPHAGARVLGIHMEGPYFNPEYRRIHPADQIRVYTKKELDEVLAVCRDGVRMFTLAPEMPHAIEFIHYLKQKGIVAAMGHTGATYEQAMQGVEAGITYSTHTFAAMREFHHREPAASGVSLLEDRITVEILPDGLHLHPGAAELAWRVKGTGGVVVATDAMAGAGLPDGEYMLAGQNVTVKDGRTVSSEGRIAGGLGTMDMAVRNMKTWLKLSVPQALRMASANPARVLGIEDCKGSLETGKDADILVCDDSFNPWMTIVEGTVMYQQEGNTSGGGNQGK